MCKQGTIITTCFENKTKQDHERGMIELNDELIHPFPHQHQRREALLNYESMREVKKSLKERGIKSEDVKNLPPIEELCKPHFPILP